MNVSTAYTNSRNHSQQNQISLLTPGVGDVLGQGPSEMKSVHAVPIVSGWVGVGGVGGDNPGHHVTLADKNIE